MSDEVIWPDGYDPPPDGWEWRLVDVECGHCGAVDQLHEQPPQWLETPEGVVWECTACSQPNRLGGIAPAVPADYVDECGNCHATFDPNQIEHAEDGTWTCPACGVDNRAARVADRGRAVTGVTA